MAEKKIDLMIIGAQKAATTSLKEYLGEHPQVMMHYRQEFAFFGSKEEQEKGFEKIFEEYYPDKKTGDNIKVAAKNAGTHEKESWIKQLSEHNPACILVFVLRNPIDRAYSSYQMEVSHGLLKYPFDDLKHDVEKYKSGETTGPFRLFFGLGFYAQQLEMIYKYFPKDNVLVYLQEDLKNDSPRIVKEIFSKLGVDDSFTPDYGKKHNVSYQSKSFFLARAIRKLGKPQNPVNKFFRKIIPAKVFTKTGNILKRMNSTEAKFPPMNLEMRKYLIDFYKAETEKLEKILHRDLTKWKQ